jgi:peptidoglycan/LPS O-acetylase OafA/YrhL
MEPRSRAPFAVGDPLRGVAALAVAVSHVIGLAVLSWAIDFELGLSEEARNAFGPAGDVVRSWGTLGVSVFFVLSGYLLSRAFLRAAVLGDEPPGLVRFARNRLLRVVPAFWAVLVVLLLVVIVPGVEEAGTGSVLRTFLFDGGIGRMLPEWIGHTWTLDIEMRFYLLLAVAGSAFALLVPRLPAAARVWVIAAATAALAVWSFAAHDVGNPLTSIGFGENVGRFAIGIGLALVEVSALRRLPAAWLGPMLFAVGLVGFVAVSVASQDPELPLGDATPWLMTLTAGAIVAGPLLWQWQGRPPWRVLDNAALRWAGSRSYSIYLIHLPLYTGLMQFAESAGYERRALLLAGTGLPLALVAAEGLHRAVERPFLRRRAPSQAVPGA